MQSSHLTELAKSVGSHERYAANQVFHSQDFPNRLFLITSGYVKRYQVRDPERKVLELIYGPGHIVSLSALYKKIFGVDQNQENFIYIYQTMTDVEMFTITEQKMLQAIEADSMLYRDFFYDAGLKLRANVGRLTSNALKDDYQKVAHQIVSLAYEFTDLQPGGTQKSVSLPLPQSAKDIAEQLNISTDMAEAAMNGLVQKKIIRIKDDYITVADIDVLKDIYL